MNGYDPDSTSSIFVVLFMYDFLTYIDGHNLAVFTITHIYIYIYT